MAIVCVTGASGIIGSFVVDELLSLGCEVRILSRFNSQDKRIQTFVGRLNDDCIVQKFVAGASAIIHCAGEKDNLEKMFSTNVDGTKKLAMAAKEACVDYFCYISSSGVVGNSWGQEINELVKCVPMSLYERSKLSGEAEVTASCCGMNVVILRPTNVVSQFDWGYIPTLLGKGFISGVKYFLKQSEPTHLVHAKDVARAAVFLLNKNSQQPEIYFVSLDHDQFNNVSSLRCLLYNNERLYPRNNINFFLIANVILRFLRTGKFRVSNGKFSSKKLINLGFSYEYSVQDIIQEFRTYNCKR